MSHRIARLALAGLLVPVLALLLAMPTAFAQIPRPHKTDGTPRKILNSLDGNKWLATSSFSRVVTVDANGSGDFTTIQDALAYVAAQTNRGGFTRYLVLVYPGDGSSTNSTTGYNFTAATLTVPDYTIVQGVASARETANNFSGIPLVYMTGTTGTLVSVGFQSTVSNLDFRIATGSTLTGNTQVVACNGTAPGSFCTLDNVTVKAGNIVESGFNLDLIAAMNASSMSCYDCSTSRNGSSSTNTRSVVNSGTGSIALYGGRHIPGSGQAKLVENLSASGSIAIYSGTRLDTGATTTLVKTGAGGITIGPSITYDSSSGTITESTGRFAKIIWSQGPQDLSGTGSPEGVVTAAIGSTYRRTDGGASTSFYVKESGTGNTGWVAK